jgi:mevalonate pyrophosphate decarboxylase
MEIIYNIITAIITSSVVSGILTTIITGIDHRKNLIFEKRREAYTKIINKIIWLINNIPYPDGVNNYTEISEESYYSFKNETEKYILYLNKNEYKILDRITELFAKNVYTDTGGGDPFDVDYLYFNKDNLNEINELKDELIKIFRKELRI